MLIITTQSLSHYYVQPTCIEYTSKINKGFVLSKLIQKYFIEIDYIVETKYLLFVEHDAAAFNIIIKTPLNEYHVSVQDTNNVSNNKCEYTHHFYSDLINKYDIIEIPIGKISKGSYLEIHQMHIAELKYEHDNCIYKIPHVISPKVPSNILHNIGNPIENPIEKSIETIYDVDHCISIHLDFYDAFDIYYHLHNVSINKSNDHIYFDYTTRDAIESDITIYISTQFESCQYLLNIKEYTMALIHFLPTHEMCYPRYTDFDTRQKIVFILDCSRSMQGKYLESIKTAVIDCLRFILYKSDISFNILRYGTNNIWYSDSFQCTGIDSINNAIEYCQHIQADMEDNDLCSALAECLDHCNNAILMTNIHIDVSNDDDILNELCKFNLLSIFCATENDDECHHKLNKISKIIKYVGGIVSTDLQINDLMENALQIKTRDYKIKWPSIYYSMTSNFPVTLNYPSMICSVSLANHQEFQFIINSENYNFYQSSDLPFEEEYMANLISKKICSSRYHNPNQEVKRLAKEFNVIADNMEIILSDDNNSTVSCQSLGHNIMNKIIEEDKHSNKLFTIIHDITSDIMSSIASVHKKSNIVNIDERCQQCQTYCKSDARFYKLEFDEYLHNHADKINKTAFANEIHKYINPDNTINHTIMNILPEIPFDHMTDPCDFKLFVMYIAYQLGIYKVHNYIYPRFITDNYIRCISKKLDIRKRMYILF